MDMSRATPGLLDAFLQEAVRHENYCGRRMDCTFAPSCMQEPDLADRYSDEGDFRVYLT